MKRILPYSIIICSLLLFFVRISYSQNGWTIQSSGTTNALWGVSFVNNNIGTAVGQNGVIVHTTDGGATWITQASGTTNTLYGVTFTDTNIGTAVGENLTILHTTNGGATWTNQSSGLSNSYNLYDAYFIDANVGTIVGNGGTILHTIDGGSTWKNQFVMPNTEISNYFYSAHFIDANIGFVVGQGSSTNPNPPFTAISYSRFLYTSNGGSTWNSTKWYGLPNLHGVCFTDKNNGTIVGMNGRISQTTDGGNTWLNKTVVTSDYYSVTFINANKGFIVGSNGAILQTTDSGSTWTVQSSGVTNNLLAVSFTDINTGTAVGSGGIILRTTTGGITGVDNDFIYTDQLPNRLVIWQNFPNPFNPNTIIEYAIPEASDVTIRIYDMLGREIKILVDEFKDVGRYSVRWDGDNKSNNKVVSGIYLCKITANKNVQSIKMILMK